MSDWLDDLPRLLDLTFQAPQRIWFGVPLLVVLLLVPFVRRTSARHALVPLLLRALVLGALLAILLEPAVPEREEKTGRVVVLADVSPSVGEEGLAAARAYLAAARVPFDLVAFGATPELAAEAGGKFELAPDPRDATDLAAALRFAAARRDPAGPLRVVLLSDGRATRPGAGDAAIRLRRHAELFAVAIPRDAAAAPPSLSLRGLDLPPVATRREPFSLRARVRASHKTRVTATLHLDGAAHRVEEVDVEAGNSEIVFDRLNLPPGRYFAQVLVAPDATPQDNIKGVLLEVPGIPRVLCLAARERESLLATALRTQDMEAEVAAATDASDLGKYDAVVLLPDAPAADLERLAPALSGFVGRRGGGLLAIGGAEGEGLARLHGTPVSFLLPLEVEPRARPAPAPPPEPEPSREPRIEIVEEEKEAYPITLCLLVDRSGSMRGPKISRAKAAAAAAAHALTPQDRIAVIAFGDTAEVVMAPRPAGNPRVVERALVPLSAHGQTSMFAALSLGYLLMREEKSAIRHMVLISDGMPTDQGRWRDLITAMTGEKITLSSVGIGFQIDKWLLSRFALWGKGRYWSANHPHEIPQVVTQDTVRIVEARERRGKDAERARPEKESEREPEPEPPQEQPPEPPAPPPAVPIVAEPGAPREMLKGLEDKDLPQVAGVEEGRPRFASWTSARAGEEGPALLAYWRVGLGTAAAFTVDPEAPGARELREHAEFPRLMAQLLRSILPDTRGEPYLLRPDLEVSEAEERLSLRVVAEDGLPRTDLPLEISVGGQTLTVQRRADRYEAALPERREPTRGAVRIGGGEAPLLERAFMLPPSYNRERAETGPDRAALLRLVGGAGRLDPPAEAVLGAPPVIREVSLRPLWLPFLLLAAILLPFDAWARRRARSASR